MFPSPSQSRWQYRNTGFHDGTYNMEYDEHLAHQLQDGKILPTLRIYGWKPHCISLGYNQNENEINKEQCKKLGIDIVRRATGGRAILHAEELTYSVVMFAENFSIQEMSASISKALVRGLQLLGANVEYSTTQPKFSSLYKNPTSVPCFTSSAKYEIHFQGKKLVGSAQRRFSSPHAKEVLLQHGSILIGTAHKKLTDVLVIDEKTKMIIQQELQEKTTELSTILKKNISFDEVAEAIKKGFEEEWMITL